MKKYFINWFISAACIIAVLPFLSAGGCGDDRELNVGYHHIRIPEFTEADYLQMLNSENKEIQYNAICNLDKDYDRLLTTDSLKGTPEFDSALMIYNKISLLMDSKDTWVSSAAVAFINHFQYNRQTFVQYVLTNKNPSLNVQLEMIMDIANDTIKDQNLLAEKISFLEKQPSWLLQNGRYMLVNNNDRLQMDNFIKDYNSTSEEYKKLLILDILIANINDTVFSFLTNEYEKSNSARVKKLILSGLPEADNPESVLKWFGLHYQLLEKNMGDMISNLDSKNEIYSKLIVLALQNGWKPSSLIYTKKQDNGSSENDNDDADYEGEPMLYISLFINKYENDKNGNLVYWQNAPGKKIEDFLLKDPEMKKGWLAFEKRMLKYPLPQDLISQHRQLTEKYLKESQLLLQKFQIDTSLYKEFIKEINNHAKELYEERVRKKE